MNLGNMFSNKIITNGNEALNLIGKLVADFGIEIEKEEMSLLLNGNTRIGIEKVESPTVDGQEVSEVITVKSELKHIPKVNDEGLVLFNQLACLGAAVRNPDTGHLSIISRLSLYKDDNDVWELYGPLILIAALLNIHSFFGSGQKLPGMDTESAWSEQDFSFTENYLNQIGMFSTSGGLGLTVEIPIEQGGLSATFGDQTSLLTINADEKHPNLGGGLFYKLELPYKFEKDELTSLANKLNLLESIAIDNPPFLGAWCSKLETGRLAYVGFWPNVLYKTGTVLNNTFWMIHRSTQAVEFIFGEDNDKSYN